MQFPKLIELLQIIDYKIFWIVLLKVESITFSSDATLKKKTFQKEQEGLMDLKNMANSLTLDLPPYSIC